MADPVSIVALTASTVALAKSVYKKCRDSPGHWRNLKAETQQLKDALEDVQDLVEDQALLKVSSRHDFANGIRNCESILQELEQEIDRFKMLGSAGNGTRGARLMSRITYDEEQVSHTRQRLISAITLLNLSISSFNASTGVKILRVLIDIIGDLRDGRRDIESVSSFAMLDSDDEEKGFQGIVKDLEEYEIDSNDATENRTLILETLFEAKAEGYIPELPRPTRTSSPIPMSPTEDDDSSARTRHSVANDGSPRLTNRTSSSMDSSLGSPILGPGLPSSYLTLFGESGAKIHADVVKGSNSLTDDTNLARTYWERKQWSKCKHHLLKILVASELPVPRRLLGPKTVTFLLGVVAVYSGDLELARQVFSALLEPLTPATGNSNTSSPLSQSFPPHVVRSEKEAHVAAATWLGDVCLMTNRREDAALAYCIALQGLRQHREHRRNDSIITEETLLPRASLTRESLTRVRTQVDGRPLLEQILACEMSITTESIHNMDHLLESLLQGWFAQSESAFRGAATELSHREMNELVNATLQEGELFSDPPALMKTYQASKRVQREKETACDTQAMSRQAIIAKYQEENGREQYPDGLVTMEAVLHPQAHSPGFPLKFNPSFCFMSALHVINWYHYETPIPNEDVTYGMRTLDAREARNIGEADVYHTDDKLNNFVGHLRTWLNDRNIEFIEKPGEFRCKPRTNAPFRWPTIACFAIRVIKTKVRFKTRYGAYVADVKHWNGKLEKRLARDHPVVDSLITILQLFHHQDKGTYRDNGVLFVPGGG